MSFYVRSYCYLYIYICTVVDTLIYMYILIYVEMSNSLGWYDHIKSSGLSYISNAFKKKTQTPMCKHDHIRSIVSQLSYSSIEVTYAVRNSHRFFNSGQGFPLNRHPSSTSFIRTKRTSSPRYIPENDFSNLQTKNGLHVAQTIFLFLTKRQRCVHQPNIYIISNNGFFSLKHLTFYNFLKIFYNWSCSTIRSL